MKKKWFLLLLLALPVAAYYFWAQRVQPPPPLTTKEQQMIDTLFATTRPQCIGRYVFDVPASFSNILPDRANINAVRISSKRLYRPAFEQRIRLREQELNAGHTVDKVDQPFLKQVYRLSDNAVIFDRNKNASVPGFGRTLEGHLYINGVAFILTQDIRDYSDPRYTKEREFYLRPEVGRPPSMANNKPQKLAELQNIMSRLSGRQNDEIPSGAGTCISEGFIRDDGGKQQEDITFVYPHNNVFSLSVWVNNSLKEKTSMLERSGEIQSYIRSINGRSLRKAKAQMAGFDASEWLITAPSEKAPGIPSAQLLFTAIANEKTADFWHPNLDVTLNNYALPPPAYSDAELVAIWDRITRSFRLRQGAF